VARGKRNQKRKRRRKAEVIWFLRQEDQKVLTSWGASRHKVVVVCAQKGGRAGREEMATGKNFKEW